MSQSLDVESVSVSAAAAVISLRMQNGQMKILSWPLHEEHRELHTLIHIKRNVSTNGARAHRKNKLKVARVRARFNFYLNYGRTKCREVNHMVALLKIPKMQGCEN